MQEAKKAVQEKLDEFEQPTEAEIQEFNESLKLEINNMLHCNLPDDITMKEAGILSGVIYEMILNPEYFLNPLPTLLKT